MTRRLARVRIIDFSDNELVEGVDEKISYCPHCKEYGFEVKLGPKILKPDEQKSADFEQWVQCAQCGTLYAAYEVKKESEIKDVVETVDNPFDSGRDFLGVDSRKARTKKRNQNEYDYIRDEQLKQELKKGSTLISYSEV